MKLTALMPLALALASCAGTDFASSGDAKQEKAKKKQTTTTEEEPKKTATPQSETKTDDDVDADEASEDTQTDPDLSEDGEVSDVDLPLQFQAFQGDADDVNCIDVQINGLAVVQMGCNKGANQFANQTLKAKGKPFCNVIRMIDRDVTSGNVISTQNAAQIRWGANQPITDFLGMRVFEAAAGTIKGEINDNADDNPKVDVSFQVSGLAAIEYTIENSGQGCKPK